MVEGEDNVLVNSLAVDIAEIVKQRIA
jgi:hypothetical protein